MTHVTSLTNGQMIHVVTLHMCPCVDMSHVMCRYAGESLSLPSQARLHHTAPLEQHNHCSHSDLTKIMTTDSLSSAVQWRNHSVASHYTNMCPGLTLISVIAATYDSISLLRLELVLRTKDLRSHKRCKLRSFYDEISTCTTINSSFAQTRTAQ